MTVASSSGITSATNTSRTAPPRKLRSARFQKSCASASWPATSASTAAGVPADISAGSLEQLRQRAVSPVPGAVRGVVEHLPNNFTADPGIGTPLHLNERRDRVLIDEQMVQAPAPGSILVGDRCLPADQKEAARITAVHLISRQQLRMVLQQLLQNRLSLKRCNRQGHEILALADEDDIIRHDPGPPKSRARSPALSRFASLRTSTSAQPWLPGFQRGVAVGSRPELGWPA